MINFVLRMIAKAMCPTQCHWEKFWKAFKELEKTELKKIMVLESKLIFTLPWILLTSREC